MKGNSTQWRSEHAMESFPFCDCPVAKSGLSLPFGLFIDASFVLSGKDNLFLYKIEILSGYISIVLVDSSEKKYTGKMTITSDDLSSMQVFNEHGKAIGILTLSDGYSKIAASFGPVVLGFHKWKYFFCSSCIINIGSSFVQSCTIGQVRHTGRMVVIAGSGININSTSYPDTNSTKISIDAVDTSIDTCCDESPALLSINAMNGNTQSKDFLIVEEYMPTPDGPLDERQLFKIEQTENGIKFLLK